MFFFALLSALQLLLGAAPETGLRRVESFPAEIDYSLPPGGEAYVYLNPEEEGTARIDAPDDYYWYGLVASDDGPLMQSVNWSDYYENQPETGMIVREKGSGGRVRLLVGSKQALTPGPLSGAFYNGYASAFGHAPALNRELLRELGMALLGTGGTAELWLGDRKGLQLLNNGIEGYPSHVVFAGDIDGDGRRDYILSYGEQKAVEVLYLSGIAGRYEAVAPAAACHYHYWE